MPILNYTDPSAIDAMLAPGFKARFEQAIQNGLPEPIARQLVKDLRQFRRVLNGDREQLGSYLDDPRLPSAPMPFARRETHIPDRAPGTPAHIVLKAAVENIDAEAMAQGLQRRMHTDSELPNEPISLREQISAAVAVHESSTP